MHFWLHFVSPLYFLFIIIISVVVVGGVFSAEVYFEFNTCCTGTPELYPFETNTCCTSCQAGCAGLGFTPFRRSCSRRVSVAAG